MEKPHMNKLATLTVALGLLASSSAIAAERTVTLAVQNMYCAACPHTVRASLQAVPGVKNVTVSLQQKTAMVTYDDAKTDVMALTAATTNAGYPSAPRN
jgi:mercuric ion binding protein